VKELREHSRVIADCFVPIKPILLKVRELDIRGADK
jgi:hypothetical protein